jgi:uncharacterized protein YjbJ (UPF0337 family)
MPCCRREPTKSVGDAKLESDGKADKMEGKVGGLKDMLRGK